MKKIVSILFVVLFFMFIYFLQINFFTWFNIAGVQPNLFIVLILFISLFMGKKYAVILGFIFGYMLDILTCKYIGVNALMFVLIGFVGEYFEKNFSKNSKITILLMVMGATVLIETVTYIYKNISSLQLIGFIRLLIIEIIFNVMLTIIIYPILARLGYIVENIFKRKKFLAKYL